MKFKELKLSGIYLIKPEKHEDIRGFFTRTFCKHEFAAANLHSNFVQQSLSYNAKRGTLRGMHYQKEPYEEIKLVSCLSGSIYDVVLDIRKNSASYGKWISCLLSEDNFFSLYIPKGFAHGFQTLTDDTLVYYQISEFFQENYGAGVHYDDPAFKIDWPLAEKIISQKDMSWEKVGAN